MIRRLLAFCRKTANYDGPGVAAIAELVRQTYTGASHEPLKQAAELGYRRGYADCAEYVADWIEEEVDDD